MILLLLFSACFEPTSTGYSGMVGTLLDSEGNPIRGIRVESEEHADVTDDAGAFVVQYKDPAQFVHFKRYDSWYKRIYQPDVDSGITEIKLPPTQDLLVSCDLSDPCTAGLDWNLGGGLSVEAKAACSPGKVVKLTAVPQGEPHASTCVSEEGSEAQGVHISVRDGTLTIGPPPRPLSIALAPADELPDGGCEVWVDGQQSKPAGAGKWMSEASGAVTVSATCAGQPALPRWVTPEDGQAVELDWSPKGPVLDLAGHESAGQALTIVAMRPKVASEEDDPKDKAKEERTWTLKIPGKEDGTWALPPLAEGHYRLAVGDAAAIIRDREAIVSSRSGVVLFAARSDPSGLGPLNLIGSLTLEKPLKSGKLEVSGIKL